VDAWVIMAQIIKANPVFGLGFSNYYWITPLFSILGWNVQFNSHNNYIDVLAQTGLVGLAFFAWFIFEVGRLAYRLRVRTPEGFARAYVYGALGGLVGTIVAGMLGDWVLPFVYNIGLDGFRMSVLAWIFLGGLVVLDQIYASRPVAA
jgi:O-antigen ligase